MSSAATPKYPGEQFLWAEQCQGITHQRFHCWLGNGREGWQLWELLLPPKEDKLLEVLLLPQPCVVLSTFPASQGTGSRCLC